ncbi:MAG: Lrp/AsnC family transcriptional regulator [Halieaceae bacterium]
MNTPQSIELDATDERIIDLLRGDGRMAYRAMAAELGLTEATVRARVRRLEDSNAMRVVAVTDFQAAGYELMLAVGIQVENRTPAEVAADLAQLPEVFSINVVIGTYDIEVLVVAEDQAALAELIYKRLALLPGVRRVSPSLAVDVLKNQPDWVPLSTKTAGDPGGDGGRGATSPSAKSARDPGGDGDRGATSPSAKSVRDPGGDGGGGATSPSAEPLL